MRVLTDKAGNHIYRSWECFHCKLCWEEVVKLEVSTNNLSGEAKMYCPQCFKSNCFSSPQYVWLHGRKEIPRYG